LPAALQQRLTDAFAIGAGHGLLQLGATEVGSIPPPAWAWWRDFAARYVTALCATADGGAVAKPDDQAFDALMADAPPMTGAEYLTPAVLATLWTDLDSALRDELAASKNSLQELLKSLHPVWNLVGRVHFNLAENRKDPEAPFAFLATYTARVSAHGRAQHLPLSQALAEFSDGKSQARLLSLLMPVQRAAEQCGWLRAMVDSGDIYHPLRWLPGDAYRFLIDVPKLEAAGIIVRAPGAWQAGRPPRPLVKASVGARPPSLLGTDALLDFSMEVTLDGERLSTTEIKALLAAGNGLQLIRGRWVEVDREKLARMLERFQAIEQAAAEQPPQFKAYASFEQVEERLMQNNPRLTRAQAAFLAPHWARRLDSGEVVLNSDSAHKMVHPVLYRFDEAIACWQRTTAPVL
jgi:non-specific serine/threonine protein kinase